MVIPLEEFSGFFSSVSSVGEFSRGDMSFFLIIGNYRLWELKANIHETDKKLAMDVSTWIK